MKSLSKTLLMTMTSALIAACASGPTPYQPAKTDSALGFTETQIENDRFRVSYTANTPEEANDLALLRAAEIAQAEGYSHFEVITGGQDIKGRRSGATPRVGVGVGTGGYGSRVGGSLGIGIPLGGSKGKVRQTLEIKLRQSGGSSPDIYAADQIIRNLSRP